MKLSTTRACDRTLSWYENMFKKTLTKTKNCIKTTLDVMELLECQHHDRHLGGVEDYLSDTRCRTVKKLKITFEAYHGKSTFTPSM